MKRALDLLVSVLGLVILWPFFLLIAAVIKAQSPGPVFYRGVRVGRDGTLFRIFKFRTMVVGADKIGGPSTAGDDPRVTWIGRFLRKYKLDELPQLLNVLKGEMSLVGPRPEVPQYVELFTQEERAILKVRPGITDWASLWNLDEGEVLAGSPDPERAYMEKVRPGKISLQLEYVRHRSFFMDLVILLQTLVAVFLRMRPRRVGELHEKR
jgi:lipopolysaccharide/colanic/teichoic acid biosynthesis glycosyltransferase